MVQESIEHFPIPLRKSPKVIAGGNFLVEAITYGTRSFTAFRIVLRNEVTKDEVNVSYLAEIIPHLIRCGIYLATGKRRENACPVTNFVLFYRSISKWLIPLQILV